MSRKIVDLSLTFANGKRGVTFEPALNIANDGFNTTNLIIYSHALTHMDAPKHFIEAGYTMEAMNLDKCIGSAIVVDVSHKANNSLIMIEDLMPYADRIQPKSRILMRTDWSKHADWDDYRTDFPRISPELAQWLVEKQIWLIGVESPSVASLSDEHRDELTRVHRILLGADVVIVEGLSNLRLLSQDEVYFVALPLKLENSDGSPVRAIAIENNENTNNSEQEKMD